MKNIRTCRETLDTIQEIAFPSYKPIFRRLQAQLSPPTASPPALVVAGTVSGVNHLRCDRPVCGHNLQVEGLTHLRFKHNLFIKWFKNGYTQKSTRCSPLVKNERERKKDEYVMMG